MPVGILHGPYGWQVVGGRLKFWFAFTEDDGAGILRYEGLIGRGDKTLKMRNRPYFEDGAPKYSANFENFRLPEDLTPFPTLPFPRHEGDRLAYAAMSMLHGDHVANLARLRLGVPLTPPPMALEWRSQ